MRTDLIDFFKSHNLTRSFSDTELEQLTNLLVQRRYAVGEIILEEGSKNNTFFFLWLGTAEVLKYDAKSNQFFRINEIGEGSLFGEMSIIGDEPVSATIRASSDCTVCLLSNEMVAHNPVYNKLVLNAARGVIDRLRDLNARHVETLGEQVKERIQKERIETELKAARNVQMALMPKADPQIAGYEIVGYCHPARDVGGDFYDIVKVGKDKTALMLGDVSGKGMPAALLMAECRSIIRIQLISNSDPMTDTILNQANVMLFDDSEDDMFVTCFLGVLEHETGALQFCNAAQNPPVIFRRDGGTVEELEPTGTVLGFSDMMEYDRVITRIDPGDVLVMYSDGISEAKNPAGEMFEKDRLFAAIKENLSRDAVYIRDAILLEVEKFAFGADQSDDITLVVVKRTS